MHESANKIDCIVMLIEEVVNFVEPFLLLFDVFLFFSGGFKVVRSDGNGRSPVGSVLRLYCMRFMLKSAGFPCCFELVRVSSKGVSPVGTVLCMCFKRFWVTFSKK